MKNLCKLINPAAVISVIVFVFLIIKEPETCTGGAAEGLLLCGRVIIPSLFPFTVCVLFIVKSGLLSHLEFTAPFTKKVFALNPELFSIMLLSFTGGYPIGSKLINEMVSEKKVSPKTAGLMLNYCVNAGPAFIILAVGSGIIGSKTVGYILLASHITASFILAFIFKLFIKENNVTLKVAYKRINAVDNFVLSTADAASASFNICAYVILFSTINSYIEMISQKFSPVKYISYLLEVTNAVGLTNNILVISFLLGFGGICVWCQVLSLGRNIKINYPVFILSRIFHGLISVILTAVLLKIFKLTVTTFSTGDKFVFSFSYTTLTLSLSMLIMVIVLIISLYTKKCAGKILEDLV